MVCFYFCCHTHGMLHLSSITSKFRKIRNKLLRRKPACWPCPCWSPSSTCCCLDSSTLQPGWRTIILLLCAHTLVSSGTSKGTVAEHRNNVCLKFNPCCWCLLFLFCRNLMLNVSVLGVLCYHWLGRIATDRTDYIKVTWIKLYFFQHMNRCFLGVETNVLLYDNCLCVLLPSSQCWETFVGQELYRFLIVDFIFTLLDTLFGELLWRWAFCL